MSKSRRKTLNPAAKDDSVAASSQPKGGDDLSGQDGGAQQAQDPSGVGTSPQALDPQSPPVGIMAGVLPSKQTYIPAEKILIPPVLEPVEVNEDKVVVNVPKPFTLRVDNHRAVEYKAGVQNMPVSHSEHWYSKVNGVEVHTPQSADKE